MSVRLRAVFYPHYDCLRHWYTIPCLGCLYEVHEYRDGWRWFVWALAQPMRGFYHRLTARFEYPK